MRRLRRLKKVKQNDDVVEWWENQRVPLRKCFHKKELDMELMEMAKILS